MNIDELSVPHDYDVSELEEALVENYAFSEPDSLGGKSDMLHYAPAGQENGYAVITEDEITFGAYDTEIDDSWDVDAERAIEDLMDRGDTRIPLDNLYNGDPSPNADDGASVPDGMKFTLDRDSEYL